MNGPELSFRRTTRKRRGNGWINVSPFSLSLSFSSPSLLFFLWLCPFLLCWTTHSSSTLPPPPTHTFFGYNHGWHGPMGIICLMALFQTHTNQKKKKKKNLFALYLFYMLVGFLRRILFFLFCLCYPSWFFFAGTTTNKEKRRNSVAVPGISPKIIIRRQIGNLAPSSNCDQYSGDIPVACFVLWFLVPLHPFL